ncbi:hypothetical protein GGR93_000026 [Sulfitobacter noctilucicola]|uniref:Uncharacterized protein n=1 Tax=Sulfitobacter noctilucicola TaxID=1342301 RepID=A0A7W6Q1P8_9RHOB|nr:hypothetical protein [Sulfitobacter noctilucicola]
MMVRRVSATTSRPDPRSATRQRNWYGHCEVGLEYIGQVKLGVA